MLVACPECHRQYDVTGMEPGESVRCRCGDLVRVPSQQSHTARIIHCSSCGGRLRDAARECEYCGGHVTLEERNLGDPCPECFARLRKGARFCSECGVEIRPASVETRRLDMRCPRCQSDLVRCTSGKAEYTECSSCGGLWLEESFFDRVVEERDGDPLGKGPTADGASGGVNAAGARGEREVRRDEVRYLGCPVCGNLMHRKNYAGCSGVIIDWCKGHGFWFDTHELERILDFVREGGLDASRERQIRRAQQELERTRDRRKAMAASPYTGSARGASAFGPGTSRGMEIDLTDVLGALGAGLKSLLRL